MRLWRGPRKEISQCRRLQNGSRTVFIGIFHPDEYHLGSRSFGAKGHGKDCELNWFCWNRGTTGVSVFSSEFTATRSGGESASGIRTTVAYSWEADQSTWRSPTGRERWRRWRGHAVYRTVLRSRTWSTTRERSRYRRETLVDGITDHISDLRRRESAMFVQVGHGGWHTTKSGVRKTLCGVS